MLDKDSIVQATTAYVPPTAINIQLESEFSAWGATEDPKHPGLGNIVVYLSGKSWKVDLQTMPISFHLIESSQ